MKARVLQLTTEKLRRPLDSMIVLHFPTQSHSNPFKIPSEIPCPFKKSLYIIILPMIFPWFSDFPWIFWWFSQDFLMVFPWIFWFSDDFLMIFPGFSDDFPIFLTPNPPQKTCAPQAPRRCPSRRAPPPGRPRRPRRRARRRRRWGRPPASLGPWWVLEDFTGQILGKSWENPGKIIRKSWENYWKILGKSWENPGKIIRKSWENYQKILGKSSENPGKIIRESWENH